MAENNCIGNEEYITAAKNQASAIETSAEMDAAISVALALWQRNSSSSISNMQKEIADRNMRLAEWLQDHASKFWPYEKDLVDDAFAETKHTEQYAALSTQWGSIMDDTLRRARSDWLEEMRQRCIRPTRCEDARWNRNAQKARADIISFADRQAEARARALNDMRYERQYAALGLGRGHLANVSSYQSIMGTLGGNAAGMLAGTINSGLEALGYYRTRERFEGWGSGARENMARMPAVQARQPTPVVNVTTPVQPIPAVDSFGPCGPPPPGDAPQSRWDAWIECNGGKP